MSALLSETGYHISACLLQEQALQLLPAVLQSLAVVGIHDPDERVGLLEVVLPVRAKGLLATDIP